MKYFITLSMLCFLGCSEPDTTETYVEQPYIGRETTSTEEMRDCTCILKYPYVLIQWNDKAYGIMISSIMGGNWFKIKSENHEINFTKTLEYGAHFKDSCEAKQNLKDFLNTLVTYKIVK